jgi:2-oxoglutarate ferredoxin oxidoreductase subunit gamma
MPLTEIRVAGFGGQGVIMAATVIGRAVCIHEQKYATMTQNFGPEARGGACSAQVVLSDEPVLYPYVTGTDVSIIMSQEAFTKFGSEVRTGGILLVERDLVRVSGVKTGVRVYGVPATRLAEELGKRMMLNIAMVGFFGAVTGLVSADALKAAVLDAVPPHTREANLKAFEAGVDFGKALVAGESVQTPVHA